MAYRRYDTPPPGYSRDTSRHSTEPDYNEDYAVELRRHDRDRDYDDPESYPSKKGPGSVFNDEEKPRRRVLSKQEKIMAGLAGATLAVGGKEIYDRREAKKEDREIERNSLALAAVGAIGAAAAYKGVEFYHKKATKEEKRVTKAPYRDGDSRDREYYPDEDDRPRGKGGSNSLLKNATGSGHDDGRDTRWRRDSLDSRSRSPSRSRGNSKNKKRLQNAAMASIIAGAAEAFRVSRKPGSWDGEKTKRVFTAATGAGAIGAAHNPDKPDKLRLAESVIGGLVGSKSSFFDSIVGGFAGNRVSGSSDSNVDEGKRAVRSRSRSRARSFGGATGIAALATAGLGAIGAKKMLDNHRERSQSRSCQGSTDSYDIRDGSPDRRLRSRGRSRGRSPSIVDSDRKSFSRMGIGSDPDAKDRDRCRDNGDYDNLRSSRRHRSHSSDDSCDDEWPPSYGRGR